MTERSVLGEVNENKPKGKKTVEQLYQKKTQLEHILLRPDSYVGSVEATTESMLVFENGGFVTRQITFTPALLKIFDEILVNAADNKIRSAEMDRIVVTIDPGANTISVLNTGKGIPIEMHSKEKVYVPELIFGNLLTSSNYDDNEKKVVGGRNGYGAKLCNIFSTEFVVETADADCGMTYKQTFTNNMSKREDPIIKKQKVSKDFTKITFKPDLAKFGMTGLDKDTVALMTRRVYDIAGCVDGIRVYLGLDGENPEKLKIKDFKGYVDMVLEGSDDPVIHKVVNDRWEVCVTVSHSGYRQMSFVNSIATTKGGSHVNYINDQLVEKITEAAKKKNKSFTIKPFQVKNYLYVFVKCLIENPSFDSQTKENMTKKKGTFGSTCVLDSAFIKDVIKKTNITEMILNAAQSRAQNMLAKASSGAKRTRLTGITKLDDANMAGGRNSDRCTLILTEGDSAKALAISGLSVVGRDYYGVFPLRGKLLNVREASHKQIAENSEIKNIVQIMGLQFGKTYTDLKSLRYGRIMIMADQDQDGSHIKGLLINFVHHFWPSLLQMEDFLVEFITPIVKCTKGTRELSFFTLPQYEAWAEEQGSLKGWKIKYYKGLGTSTPKEAKAYFQKMDSHQIPFKYEGEEDDTAINMAFSKKKVEERKVWLQGFQPGTYLDHDCDAIAYNEFINKELILFSMADNVRSIPSIVDGFKPGQRKVLFSCLKRKLKDEIKVAQLAGYVSEHSAYHHGEVSLAGTIVNMAQDYVGSNNLNLLLPVGQFGTRLQGGKDAASPRYIFTKLNTLTRLIFNQNDDALLSYLNDDGMSIEPEWYMPIMPMVLVNGADGIGTGWSTHVPTYNPEDIVNNIKHLMRGEEMEEMTPWFRDFTGRIEKREKEKDRYSVFGVIEEIDETTLRISELPAGTWTQSYKEFLETCVVGTDKNPQIIKDYVEHHTDTTVLFTLTLTPEQMAEAKKVGLEKRFKLESSISTSNMVLFDSNGHITRYESPEDIIQSFYTLRLTYYQKRKAHMAERLTEEWSRLDNKVRFILAVINGTLTINNRKKKDILVDLRAKGFTPYPKTTKKSSEDNNNNNNEEEEEDEQTEQGATANDYDYLLSMPLWNLTMEKVEKLKGERDTKETELNTLLAKTPENLWEDDLEDFLQAWNAEQSERSDEAEYQKKVASKSRSNSGIKKKGSKKKDDDDEDDWKPAAKKKTSKPKPKSTTASNSMNSSNSSDTSTSIATTTTVAKSKNIAKAKPAALVEKEDDDAPMSLMDRLAARKNVQQSLDAFLDKPSAKDADESDDDFFDSIDSSSASHQSEKRGPKRAAKPKKMVVESDSEEEFIPSKDDDNDSDAFEPKKVRTDAKKSAGGKKASTAKAKAAPKKAAAKKVVDSDSDEDDYDFDKENEIKPVKKATAPKKKAAAKPAAKKAAAKPAAKTAPAKPKKAKDSDDEFSADEEKENIKVAPKSTAGRSRRAAASKVKYNFSDDEEEAEVDDVMKIVGDSDDEPSFAEDDSDSDFSI